MKKILFLCSCILLLLSGCDEEKIYYNGTADDAVKQIPLKVQLQLNDYSFRVLKLPVKDVVGEIGIELLSPPQNEDLTVKFEVLSNNALENVHYTLSAKEFVIPKGSRFGTVKVTVKHSGFMIEEHVQLTLQLKPEGKLAPSSEKQSCAVTLFKENFCPYERNIVEGTWNVDETTTFLNNGNAYPLEETHTIKLGQGDTMVVDNLWYRFPNWGWGETYIISPKGAKFIFDTSDQTNPTVVPVNQLISKTLDPNGTDQYEYWMRPITGQKGTVNACNNTLTLIYGIADSPTGAPFLKVVAKVKLVQ